MVAITEADLIYPHITIPAGTLIEFKSLEVQVNKGICVITWPKKYAHKHLAFNMGYSPVSDILWLKIKG